MPVLGGSQDGVHTPPDTLAAALVSAEKAAERLRHAGSLREAAQRLVDQAARVGCVDLVAASQAAEPLVTAAMLMSNGSLRMTDIARCVSERVLLVDAATVTGNSTRACAMHLRARGTTWIAAAIYDRVRPDLDSLDADPAFDSIAELGSQLDQ